MECFSFTSFTPCTNYIGSGLGLALLAALCNGSFSALAKCDRVRRAQVRASNVTAMNSGHLHVSAATLLATCGFCPDSAYIAHKQDLLTICT
jgi:hypothetical protein